MNAERRGNVVATFAPGGLACGMTDDQIREMQRWFEERGHVLFPAHEWGDGWRALAVPAGVDVVGNAISGLGSTPLEAAEDAKRKFEDEYVPTTRTHVISVELAGRAELTTSGDGTSEVVHVEDEGLKIDDEVRVEHRSELMIDEEIADAVDREVAEFIASFDVGRF